MRYRPFEQTIADLFAYAAKGGAVERTHDGLIPTATPAPGGAIRTLRRAIKGARRCRVSSRSTSVPVTKAALLRSFDYISPYVERFELHEYPTTCGGRHVELVALDADDNQVWTLQRGVVTVY